MANLRVKAASAVKKIDAPADWAWNRWLKVPQISRREFYIADEEVVTVVFKNLSPPENWVYEFILPETDKKNFKEFDKWLRARSSKSIHFNILHSKTSRFFIQVATPKISENKIPDCSTSQWKIDKLHIKTGDDIPDKYSQILNGVVDLIYQDDFQKEWMFNAEVISLKKIWEADYSSTGEYINVLPPFKTSNISNDLLQDSAKIPVIDGSFEGILFPPEISYDLLPSSDVREVTLLNVDEFCTGILELKDIVIDKTTVHSAQITFQPNTKISAYKKQFIITSKKNFLSVDTSLESADITPNFFEYDSLIAGTVLKYDTSVNITIKIPLQAVENITPTKPYVIETGDLVNSPILAPAEETGNISLNYYQFQESVAEELLKNPYSIIDFETGLGKKIQVIKALNKLFRKGKINRACIICPDESIGNNEFSRLSNYPEGWQGSFYLWSPENSVKVIDGSTECNLPIRENILIISDQFIFKSDSPDFISQIRSDMLIIDETIIPEERENLINKLKSMSYKYCWLLNNDITEKSAELFSQKKNKWKVIKKTREEVHQYLPERIKKNKWFLINKEQSIDYDSAFLQGQIKLYSTIERGNLYIIRPHIFTLLHQLIQICNFALSNLTGAKMDFLLKMVRSSEGKFIVFTQYEKYGLDPISVTLKSEGIPFLISKSSSAEGQNKILEVFEKDKQIKILIADAKGFSRKLNLICPVTIIHFDQWWNPASKNIIEEKIKSSKNIITYNFFVKNTVEEKIYSVLLGKGMWCEHIFSKLPANIISEYIATEEWLDLLSIKHTGKIKIREPLNLTSATPKDIFEYLKIIFSEFGYTNLKSGDNGQLENVIILSRLIPEGEDTIIIQYKMKDRIEVYDITNFVNALKQYKNINHSFFITFGYYTPETRKYLHSLRNEITFLDGKQLNALYNCRKV